ncbi:MAG: hypothetical protein NC184_04215 [Roseburia sp.]|nr:hypothetical protein [Roseburia sp.]
MEKKIVITYRELEGEPPVITEADFDEFARAKTHGERMQILLRHSQKNNEAVRRRSKGMEKTQQQIEREMLELNEQFGEFLREKNVFKKFKIAFSNMGENARKQHEKDKADFRAAKAKSAEENAEFAELIHTKGFKAKCKLIIENMKNSAKEANARTAAQIAKSRAQTQASIAGATAHARAEKPVADIDAEELSAESLVAAFNEFLKAKGLDGEYSVAVSESDDAEE